MSDEFGQRTAVEPTHSEHTGNDSIFVSFWQVRAGQGDLTKEHGRIRAVLSGLRLSLLLDAAKYPARLDHVHVGVYCGVVVGKVDCLGDDVGVSMNFIYTAVGSKRDELRIVLLECVVYLLCC